MIKKLGLELLLGIKMLKKFEKNIRLTLKQGYSKTIVEIGAILLKRSKRDLDKELSVIAQGQPTPAKIKLRK